MAKISGLQLEVTSSILVFSTKNIFIKMKKEKKIEINTYQKINTSIEVIKTNVLLTEKGIKSKGVIPMIKSKIIDDTEEAS